MKQNKTIIALAIILLLAITAFMAYDFFGGFDQPEENPYAYNLDKWKQVDSSLISHEEIQHIEVNIEVLRAIALDMEDNIYVSGKEKLLIYDKVGKLLQEIPTQIEAFCMCISEKGILYLGSRKFIQLYNLQGELLDTWTIHNEKAILTSLAVDENNLYLADAGNKIVYRYNLQGEFLNEIGKKDLEQEIDGFIIPSPFFDLAIGRDGELWAVNSGRHQLESYDAEGHQISSWNKSSMDVDGFSGCCNPSHIALLSNGSFVSSEKGIERIKISSPSGEFLSVVAPPEAFEKGTKGIDLAIDSEDRIIAIDTKKNSIRIFQEKKK
jgi:sugar lactone lactonase YvrE